jgi:hypothetical protein
MLRVFKCMLSILKWIGFAVFVVSLTFAALFLFVVLLMIYHGGG